MTGVLVIAAIFAGSLICLLWAFSTAPEGWQDENGFHFGREPGEPEP